jgi:hypothetical protein
MDIVLYSAEDGALQLEVQLDRETVWLTQRQMADLFDKDTIGLHIRNVYKEGELLRKGTTEESSVVQNEEAGYNQETRCDNHIKGLEK